MAFQLTISVNDTQEARLAQLITWLRQDPREVLRPPAGITPQAFLQARVDDLLSRLILEYRTRRAEHIREAFDDASAPTQNSVAATLGIP